MHSRDNFRQDSFETSRTKRPPLKKEFEKTALALTDKSPFTIEQVIGELREATVQYTSCSDPIKSAAIKQRVIQGEARGLMPKLLLKL